MLALGARTSGVRGPAATLARAVWGRHERRWATAAIPLPTIAVLWIVASLMAAGAAFAQNPFAGSYPEPVVINGHRGDAMNPFISRDGRHLFFSTRPNGAGQPDLLVAARIDARTFRSLEPVSGANSSAKDDSASLDRAGQLYFVSNRNYAASLNTLYGGRFAQARARSVRALTGLEAQAFDREAYDAEISADGRSLYVTDARHILNRTVFWEADLFVARRSAEGRFTRDPRSRLLFARLNTDALEYGAATSADELEIYFARRSRAPIVPPSIWRATRPVATVRFSAPTRLQLEGHVEAPSVAPDGSIYFHRREGGHYRLYRLPRYRQARTCCPAIG